MIVLWVFVAIRAGDGDVFELRNIPCWLVSTTPAISDARRHHPIDTRAPYWRGNIRSLAPSRDLVNILTLLHCDGGEKMKGRKSVNDSIDVGAVIYVRKLCYVVSV